MLGYGFSIHPRESTQKKNEPPQHEENPEKPCNLYTQATFT